MSATSANTIAAIDKDSGKLAAQTSYGDGINLKVEEGEPSKIRGYAATTHVDDTDDKFDVAALEEMAAQINRASDRGQVDMVMPEIDGMEESQIGNINHNNNPAAERLIGAGDTRTISVFKTVKAEVHTLDDGENGLFVESEMLPLPDDVEEAVKGQLREGALDSFSIEFTPTNVNFEVVEGQSVRRILSAEADGMALTGRPMNKNADITDAELKNIMAQQTKNEVKQDIDDECISKKVEEGMSQDQAVAACANMDAKFPEEVKQNQVFSSQDRAMEEAERMGLEGVHSMTVDGDTMFMPGESHEDFVEATKARHMDENNVKTEDTTMTEDTQEEAEQEPEEPEQEPEPEDGEGEGEGEDGELKSDVKELKSMFEDIKSENEELKQENKELKSELEDYKEMKEVKSQIGEIKSVLEDSNQDLEGDKPISDASEQREVKSGAGDKPAWQRAIDQLGHDESDLKSQIGKKGMTRAESIAESHDVSEQEVMDYVN